VTFQKGTYKKPCKFCLNGPIIVWDDVHKYFANPSGEKHSCGPSAKQNQDEKLNSMINDLKSEISAKFSGIERQMDSIQRGQIHTQSMLTEIRLKLNEALTCYGDK
jgi:hypothetical protein